MLCSSSRLLCRRKGLRFASVLFPNHLSSGSEQTHFLVYGKIRTFTSSLPPKARFLGSAYYCDRRGSLGFWRSDHTMATQAQTSVHDFTVRDARGNDVNLSSYKGKVLLIVNVASQCGLTDSNYTEMTQLYEKYRNKGLEILAFPCNQFKGQEPGTDEEILEFACTRFKAEYPVFSKVDVNGETAAPLYKFLKSAKEGFLGEDLKWNFSKFLADKDGNVVDRYAPTTSPLSIEEDIKKLLGEN